MPLDDSILGLRLRVMRRAQEAGVSAACREAGISRTVFYRWRKRLERYGPDGLHPRRRHAQRGRPVQLAPEGERLIVSVALSAGAWGCGRIAAHLAHRWKLRVAPSSVQRALRRAGVATRRAPVVGLVGQAAHTVGLLTERTRRRLWPAGHGRTRH